MKEQRVRRKACNRLLLSYFMVICVRGLLTPLLIKNERHVVPPEWSGCDPLVYSYRDVFVFGIRIIRYQVP